MGLDIKDMGKVCGETYRRYQKTGNKGRGAILDEYTVTLGFNRDYLAHWGKTVNTVAAAGKPVKIVSKPSQKRGKTAPADLKRGRKPSGRGIQNAADADLGVFLGDVRQTPSAHDAPHTRLPRRRVRHRAGAAQPCSPR